MNKNNPNEGLVSIIIPVYNNEKYLHRSIKSTINQDYKNIETILIDDGSTDSSGKICDGYANNDRRFKVIHTENKGQSAARNNGIKNSRGEFLFFLDSDDFIKNNSLSLLTENYKRYKADIVVGDFKKVNENNDIVDSGHKSFFLNSTLLTKQDIIKYVKMYLKKPNKFPLFVYSWGRLFKSSIIKDSNINFNDDLHTFEDVAFNFEYLNHTNRIFFLNRSVYNHQIYNNYSSATMTIGDNPKKLFGYKYALTKIKDFLENYDHNENIKKEIGHADVCYTIIQLVRTCGQVNNNNKEKIYELVNEIVNDSNFRDNLNFYSPSKGDSKILPFLMKLKFNSSIISVCKHKAYKRYKKNIL